MRYQATRWARLSGQLVLASICLLWFAVTPLRAAEAVDQIEFSLPAGPLDQALMQFSKQAGIQVTSSAEQLQGLTSEAVVGKFTLSEALNKLLGNSGLSFKRVGSSAVSIGRFTAAQKSEAGAAVGHDPVAPTVVNTLLEEIVVTATKRAEEAQKVGITITAFSAEQMKQLGIVNSSDLSLYTPGLQLQTSGGEGNTMSMTLRGVGQNDFNDHQESPVAIYVDGVYASALTATSFQAFDLERVEVLRGPQGTLFGRNATGGLVQFVTAKPTKTDEGYIDLGYGRFNDFTAEGALGGPLTDSVQARASFAMHHRDPYFSNSYPNGVGGNGKNDVAGRVQLQFQPSDALDVRLVARGSDSQNGGPRGTPATTSYNADGLAVAVPADVDAWGTGPGNNPYGYRYRGSDPWAGAFDQNNPLRLSQWGTTAHLTYTSGPWTTFSITDYSYFKHLYREDSDLGPTRGLEYAATTGIGQFSQELRAQYDSPAFNAIMGAYYLNIDGKFRNEFLVRVPVVPATPEGPEGIGSLMDWQLRTISYSGFGQVDWSFTEALKLTLGARWTRDEKHDILQSDLVPLQLGQDVLTLNDANLVTLLDYDNRRSDSFWSWKGGLNWTPTNNLLLFASVTRGQKGGSYNVPFFGSDSSTISFRPEQLTSYETGFKWSGSGFVRKLNASFFHYDYQDYQAFEFVNGAGTIFNVDATIDGGEAEITLNPIEPLTVQLGSAFIFESKVKDVRLPSGRLIDSKVPQTPNLSLTGLIRYDWTIPSGTISAQADGRYQAEQYFDAYNSPVNLEPAYGIANLRLFYALANKGWTTSLYVENVANNNYRTFSVDLGTGIAQQWLGAPRTYGIQGRYKF